MAVETDITVFAGEDIIIAATMSPVVDISGWTLQFRVRPDPFIPPVLFTKTTGAGITITNGPAGQFQVQINSADTNATAWGTYYYDVQRTDPGFHKVMVTGTFTINGPNNPITSP